MSVCVCGQQKQSNDHPPHPAQPQHTNHWAPRTRKRHQQEHQPQRPTERSDPTQHAKGRTGDRPGPRKGATTGRNVTRGGGADAKKQDAAGLCLHVSRFHHRPVLLPKQPPPPPPRPGVTTPALAGGEFCSDFTRVACPFRRVNKGPPLRPPTQCPLRAQIPSPPLPPGGVPHPRLPRTPRVRSTRPTSCCAGDPRPPRASGPRRPHGVRATFVYVRRTASRRHPTALHRHWGVVSLLDGRRRAIGLGG